MTCQRNWLYLESIFSAPDIQRQLPAEAKMFMTVDKSWKEIMRKVARLPNAMRAATQPGKIFYHVYLTSFQPVFTRRCLKLLGGSVANLPLIHFTPVNFTLPNAS